MAETFFILEKKSDDHGQFSNLGFNTSHPHLYLGRHSKGNEMLIMSRVGDYKPGSGIQIDGVLLTASSKYFIDHSVLSMSMMAPGAAAIASASPGITIEKEIMVVLTDVRLKGNFREAVGTIFYLPPDALDKKPEPVKASIKEGGTITITTDVPFDELEHYRTFLQRAYGFAKLRDVRLPGALAGSTTITANHTAPKSAGFLSQHDLDKALRP